MTSKQQLLILLLAFSCGVSMEQWGSLKGFPPVISIVNRYTPVTFYCKSKAGETAVHNISTTFLDSFIMEDEKPDELELQFYVNDTVHLRLTSCHQNWVLPWVPQWRFGLTIPRDTCTKQYEPRFRLYMYASRPITLKLAVSNLRKQKTLMEILPIPRVVIRLVEWIRQEFQIPMF